MVFPWVDSYPQFALLRIFAENSHTFVLSTNDLFSNYPFVGIPAVYSEWPGFFIISLSLSSFTGLTLFDTAIFLPLILFALWFVIGYALVRTAPQWNLISIQKPASDLHGPDNYINDIRDITDILQVRHTFFDNAPGGNHITAENRDKNYPQVS